MPWKEASTMSLRLAFVEAASGAEANIRALCREFSISAPTGYKWLTRYRSGGPAALGDLSRRPKRSPLQTVETVERTVLALRKRHMSWGGRKIRARLLALGEQAVPAPSTITAICKRNGLVAEALRPQRDLVRFAAGEPNELWQMDFKGPFTLLSSQECHPLTVLDDHSRFSLGLEACPDQARAGVQERLTGVFRSYGLPEAFLIDNGGPWGSCGRGEGYTRLGVWLLRLGIRLLHSRVRHPQTLGKDERFHRTLKAELLSRGVLFRDLADCQRHFDQWRRVYNEERPHEALGLRVPASAYHASVRPFPEKGLPLLEYAASDVVRKVGAKGEVSFHGQSYKIGKAFTGYPVALRTTATDGRFAVVFVSQEIAYIDLKQQHSQCVNDVPEHL